MDEGKPSLHVFIIPDGNRRWAQRQGVPEYLGYAQGYTRVQEVIQGAWDLGVTHLTIWALSLDNIRKRSKQELTYLFSLLDRGLDEVRSSDEFKRGTIRFRAIGNYANHLPLELVGKVDALVQDTKKASPYTLTFALAYDFIWEYRATDFNIWSRSLKYSLSFEEMIPFAPTGVLPPVDIYIRTSGEKHFSGGPLFYRMLDVQPYYPEKFWPDFTINDLSCIINDFRSRERRHGK